MRRFLALFLLLGVFATSGAFAAECLQYRMDYGYAPWSSSKSAACSSGVAALAAHNPNSSFQLVGQDNDYCHVRGTNAQGGSGVTSYGFYEKPGTCGDPVCQSQQGQAKVVNFTVGYTRTPNIDADPNWKLIGVPNKVPASGLLCNPQSPCEMRFNGFSDSDMAWQSAAPTPNGLYRLSLDISATFTGETCTPTETDNAALSKTATIPPCPGFTGEVNGVPGCYGTASNPTSNDVSEPKPKTPQSGNPAAGEKPATGEGSGSDGKGRTPSTGNGGPGGGPAAAAGSGKAPDGTTPKPGEGKEQANCGAPGQPKCGIDEGGTPSKFEGNNAALDKWKSDVEANRNTIKDANGSFFESYSMFFAVPPIVPCEPIELPNEVLLTRQCEVVEGTRSVMSYIWALAAIWICLGWIREAI